MQIITTNEIVIYIPGSHGSRWIPQCKVFVRMQCEWCHATIGASASDLAGVTFLCCDCLSSACTLPAIRRAEQAAE